MSFEDRFAYSLGYWPGGTTLIISETAVDADFHRTLLRQVTEMLPGRTLVVYLRHDLPEPATAPSGWEAYGEPMEVQAE